MIKPASIFTIAAFNQQNWNAVLKKEFGVSSIQSCEFDQSIPAILQPGKDKAELCLYWITLRDVELALSSNIDIIVCIKNLADSFKYCIIVLPVVELASLPGDTKNEIYRIQHGLHAIQRVSDFAVVDPTFALLQTNHSVNDSLWYLSKTPYHKNVYIPLASFCKSIWNDWLGQSKKVLIVDLDDTIWGGIVGDDGWENLKIGGHDPIGEAFLDVQKWISQLKSQGILIAICSKNEESNVWEAFEKNSGMLLKKSDFTAWRINWNDKAENIVDLIKELNVGMDSVVFLDDNPAERNRINTTFPEILVPELPHDKMQVPRLLKSLTCFYKTMLTDEDVRRTELYHQEAERKKHETNFKTTDEWIASLQIEIRFEELSESNVIRAEQLLNKTNQMNLRTRRMNKEEMWNWASKPDHWFYVVYVKDIFGDNGITGLLGFHKSTEGIFMDDFVMSCRVMGRKIENEMLNFILNKACNFNLPLIAHYLPTEKNKPIKDFFDKVASATDNLHYLS